MNRRQRAPTWKLPPLRNFEAVYFLTLIALFGISIGSSFGWRHYMDKCCSGTVGARSYVFIPWVVAFTIVAWTLFDLALKQRRVGAVGMLVARFATAYDILYANLQPPLVTAKSVVNYRKPDGGWRQLHAAACMRGVALALYAALALTLWQVCTDDAALERDAERVADAVMAPGVATVAEYVQNKYYDVIQSSQIGDDFKYSIKTDGERLKSRALATFMLRQISLRIAMMGRSCALAVHSYPYLPPTECSQITSASPMFIALTPAESAVARLIEAVNELLAECETQRLWRGISIPVAVIGLLFPIFIPPVFYSVMGGDIVYIGPLLCLCVSGAVLYNVCTNNPLRVPSTRHMGPIYDRIMALAEHVEALHASHFCVRLPDYAQDDQGNFALARKIHEYESPPQFMSRAQTNLIPRPSASRDE